MTPQSGPSGCYSALVYAEVRKLGRKLGVKIDPDWYVEEFWIKKGKDPGKRLRMPRALELAAIADAPPVIAAAVCEADQAEADRLTQELFAQRKRVADAERSLQVKETRRRARTCGSAATRSRPRCVVWTSSRSRPMTVD